MLWYIFFFAGENERNTDLVINLHFQKVHKFTKIKVQSL